ncbi:MAG: hypothetical protein ACQEXI_17725 [Pseudomonadota bacterium]
MIGNWESFGNEDSQRYLEFATAYLRASEDVCSRMASSASEKTWANASVALMLAAHSVELFLKGMLLSKGIKNSWGHSIDSLYDTYRSTYPGDAFSFDCPFVTEYLGMSDEEINEAKEKSNNQASVVFRYPVNRPGVEWDGIHGFEPDGFLEELESLNSTYSRLEGLRNAL